MRAFSYTWSIPVTWQRWRSHHLLRHNRKSHAVSKLYGSVYYRTGVTADQSGNSNFLPFLLLWPWPWHTNLTCVPLSYTGDAKMNFLRQGFRKLSQYRYADRHRQIWQKLYITLLRGWSTNEQKHCGTEKSEKHSKRCEVGHREN